MPNDTTPHAPLPTDDLADLVGRGSLPAELRHANGMKKLDFLVGLPALGAFIETLAAEEFYLLLRDIGKQDAYPLLAYATDAQLRSLVDLDAWRGHELIASRWFEWLDLALAVDIDTALRFVQANDDEVLEWLFIKDVAVLGNDVELSDIPDELAAFESPDGMYIVTVPREHELAERLPQLMKLLWAADMDRVRVIFQQARFDLPASVEEYMNRFRGGRLQDLGFEAPSEAPAVFSAANAAALRERVRGELEELAPLSGPYLGDVVEDLVLRGVKPPNLLRAALAELDEIARSRFGEAMTALVNRVFMALTGDLSRTEELPTAGRHAAALVNLGLQYIADDDLATATRALERVWPIELFQAGHGLTIEVAKAARRVRRDAGADAGLALFGAPTDEALHGVALARPLLFEGVTDPRRMGYRPFAELDELAKVAALVEDAAAVLGFFREALGFSPEALAELVGDEDALRTTRLATLFRTALAQLLLSDAFSFEPLSGDDVVAFARAAFKRDGSLSDPLRAALASVVEAAPEAVGRFAERALEELATAIGRVRPDELELRFVSELLLTHE